jgi:hypothetical protein
MTFQEANRPGGPALTMEDEPAEVRSAAYGREFGSLLGTRRTTSTRHSLIIGGAIAGGCLLVDLALWPVVSNEDPLSAAYGPMHAIYRGMVLGIVAGLAIAIRALVTGQHSFYLYVGGIVHARRSTVRSIPWSEIVRVAAIHERRSTGTNVGKVLGYRVMLADGRKLAIPLSRAARQGGRDPFIDRLLDSARARNLPVA